MERRFFLLALAGFGLASSGATARLAMPADFRTADLQGGSFALQTSRLALARTSNRDVVNFAHAEIAEQVQVANALGAAPGSVPLRPDHSVTFEHITSTPSGHAFDRMYVQGQLRGHRELLELNSSYLRSGRNPQEQGVAQMSLPIIQRHLAILSSLREIA
jgi:putative membrane protein